MTAAEDRRHRDRLRRLCREAERDLAWDGLAKFIDALHTEHERFGDKIRRREIGRYV